VLHKELSGSHLTSVRFQPDGGLFATSQLDGTIKLWDITSQQEILKLYDHGVETVSSISFSENGYYLAACGEEDQTVRVWDIRKNKVVKTLQLEEGNYVSKVKFDNSGNYLVTAGHKIGVCDLKTMTLLNSNKFEHHKNICTSAMFGDNINSYLISASLDGEIKIHA
jgi:pre-mRNA-processing factor 19